MSLKAKDARATKASVSLYGTDMKQIEKVMDFMWKKKRRITTSNAVQLCLRSATVSDDLLTLFEEIRKEDHRRKK